MRRLLLIPVLSVLALAGAAPASQAYVIEYGEGSTSIGNASLQVDRAGGVAVSYTEPIVRVKPTAGTNTFYWYVNDEYGAFDPVMCYFWRQDGGSWKVPGGAAFDPITVNVPGSGCVQLATGTIGYVAQTSGGAGPTVASGSRVDYCAKEWIFSSGTWQRSAYPTRCVSVVYDATAPTGTVQVRDATGRVGATNVADGLQDLLTYSDAQSGAELYNSRCSVVSRACVPTSDTYDFAAPCSSGTWTGALWSFSCTFNWTQADGTIHQCFKLYEGVTRDGWPSNLANNFGPSPNLADDNPGTTTQTFASTDNDYAHACGSIVLDRVQPSGTAQGSTATVLTGASFTASVAPSDDRSGVASTTWAITGGDTATGTSVTRSFSTAGTRTFTATITDNAGNVRTTSVDVVVQTPPAPGGGGGGTTGGDGTTGGGTTGGGTTPGGTTGGTTGGGGTTTTPVTPRNTVKPKVLCVRKVGKVFTCSTGTWTPVRGVTFTYKWKRGAFVIARATGRSYKLVAADKGKRIACVVTAKRGTRTASATSAATLAVLAA